MQAADYDLWKQVEGQEVQFCDYLTYADRNAIPLQDSIAERAQQFTQEGGICDHYDFNVTYDMWQTDKQLDNLMTATFGQTVADLIAEAHYSTSQETASTNSQNDVKDEQDPPLVFANYQLLDNRMMAPFAQELLDMSDVQNVWPNPASSNLVIEVGKDRSVRTYWNDRSYSPKCSSSSSTNSTCSTTDFVDSLTKRSNELTKVECRVGEGSSD